MSTENTAPKTYLTSVDLSVTLAATFQAQSLPEAQAAVKAFQEHILSQFSTFTVPPHWHLARPEISASHSVDEFQAG